jgi:hypothetical protein
LKDPPEIGPKVNAAVPAVIPIALQTAMLNPGNNI